MSSFVNSGRNDFNSGGAMITELVAVFVLTVDLFGAAHPAAKPIRQKTERRMEWRGVMVLKLLGRKLSQIFQPETWPLHLKAAKRRYLLK